MTKQLFAIVPVEDLPEGFTATDVPEELVERVAMVMDPGAFKNPSFATRRDHTREIARAVLKEITGGGDG